MLSVRCIPRARYAGRYVVARPEVELGNKCSQIRGEASLLGRKRLDIGPD